VAKARTRSGTGGQANAPPAPAPNLPGQPQGTPDDGASRPVRESAPDRVALLAAGVVLAAIALAAWLALFRVH